MIGYTKYFDSKIKSFKVIDNKLLRKYTQIWKKVRNLLHIKFDSELVYGDNDKYIKTKIKIYGDKVNTNFQGKKIPKENSSCECLPLIMLDSVVRVNKKYYPQTLLEECKLKVTLTMSLILSLIMNLIMRLTMNLTMNNLLLNLRIKTVF